MSETDSQPIVSNRETVAVDEKKQRIRENDRLHPFGDKASDILGLEQTLLAITEGHQSGEISRKNLEAPVTVGGVEYTNVEDLRVALIEYQNELLKKELAAKAKRREEERISALREAENVEKAKDNAFDAYWNSRTEVLQEINRRVEAGEINKGSCDITGAILVGQKGREQGRAVFGLDTKTDSEAKAYGDKIEGNEATILFVPEGDGSRYKYIENHHLELSLDKDELKIADFSSYNGSVRVDQDNDYSILLSNQGKDFQEDKSILVKDGAVIKLAYSKDKTDIGGVDQSVSFKIHKISGHIILEPLSGGEVKTVDIKPKSI